MSERCPRRTDENVEAARLPQCGRRLGESVRTGAWALFALGSQNSLLHDSLGAEPDHPVFMRRVADVGCALLLLA